MKFKFDEVIFWNFFLMFITVVEATDEWGYGEHNGPEHWCRIVPDSHCCGENQSPVRLNIHDAQFVNHKLKLKHYKQSHSGITVTNNGHTIVVKLNTMNPVPKLNMESLHGDYLLDSIHFHWGHEDDEGSEHDVGGRAALEAHMVHVKKEYGTVKEAEKHLHDRAALAVIGVLFEVSHESQSEHFTKLFSDIAKVVHTLNEEHSFHNDKNMRPEDFLPTSEGGENLVLDYDGSLTTPKCNPIVKWFVATKKMKVTKEQLAHLRKVVTDHPNHPLLSNYRHIHELNGRVVKKLHMIIES